MTMSLKRGETLVIATHNLGKLKEFEELLGPYGLRLQAAGGLGVPEPEETGATFIENAQLKALASALATQKYALGDDSGLEVDALGGAPGIYSARWAGETRDFSKAMQLVEDKLQALGAVTPEARRARFVCALCLASPDGKADCFEGRVEGHVIWPPRGSNGFGYDPMFVPEGHALTFGEMLPAQKHELSHRFKAFAAFKAALNLC